MRTKDGQVKDNRTIAEWISSGAPLKEKKAMKVVRAVCRQLFKESTKEGFSLPVLSPQNVLVSGKGAVSFAEAEKESRKEQEPFLPPEYGKAKVTDENVWIYGLGMLFLYLLTGKTQKSELDIATENEVTKEAVHRCTALDSRRRFQSLLEVQEFLNRELRFPRKRIRRAVYAAVIGIAVLFSVHQYREGRKTGEEKGQKEGYREGYREGYEKGTDDAPGVGIEQTDVPAGYGNFAGNRYTKTGAYAATGEDSLYYICDNRIFRMDPYTKETSQLVKHEKISELHYWNGYLYYLTENAVVRLNTESRKEETVSDSLYGQFSIFSGKLYLDDEKNSGYLYSIDTDSLETKQLNAKQKHPYLNVADGRLIFADSEKGGNLYGCDLDGGNAYRLLSSACKDIVLCKDKLYCLTTGNEPGQEEMQYLVCMNREGGDAEMLTEQPICRFIASEKGIFFISAENRCLEWMSPDGKTRYTVSTAHVTDFNIAGRWIIYRISGSEALYRMRIDGSDSERIPQSISAYQ